MFSLRATLATALCLAAVCVRGEITHEEAKCIMEGKKVAFFGDSITRFCTMFFNYWLEEGEIQPGDFFEYDGEEWGLYDEDRDNCCNSRPTWTGYGVESSSSKHRQFFVKEDFGSGFDDQPTTEFRFLQNVYFDDDESGGQPSIESISDEVKDYDYIVYNCGWWNLKDKDNGYCGLDWDDGCAERYDDMWDSLDQTLFSGDATLIYRGSTCCGEGDEDEWGPAIQDQNAQAKKRIEASGGTFVDVYDLYDYDDIVDNTATFDSTHPSKENCLIINKMVLEAIDVANGSPCTGGGGGGGGEDDEDEDLTYQPTYSPTKKPVAPEPTYSPTKKPVAPEPTYSPTKKPVAPEPTYLPTEKPVAPEPTYAPTPKPIAPAPTYAPTKKPVSESIEMPTYEPTYGPSVYGCDDDDSWFKKDDPSKDCDWVSKFTPTRCAVRGEDSHFAYQSCQEACGTCYQTPCADEDSTSWSLKGQPDKDCAWVAEAYISRCARFSDDDVYAFEACPYACRTCGQPNCGRDSSTWSIQSDESKDCDWAAESSRLRCPKFGVDSGEAVMAFVACPQACQVCPGYLGEGCDDDDDWHKKGEPDKDCEWVAEFFPRCNTKGEDDSFAYQLCREACDTC